MKTIAVSGKGGTGKTTLSALIVRWLAKQHLGPVLAVDADSNVNLNDLLGVEVGQTLGAIREEMRRAGPSLPGGMTKQEFLQYKIHSSLVETPDFDLLAMGRPEGPGCYCYANNLLRDILTTLSGNYAFVVIDNEAGMEHLSRRTTQSIDVLLIVSDPSVRGIRTAGRIARLVEELDIRIGYRHGILNRIRGDISIPLRQGMEEAGLDLLAAIPEDPRLLAMDETGQSLLTLPDDTPAPIEIDRLMKTLLEETDTLNGKRTS